MKLSRWLTIIFAVLLAIQVFYLLVGFASMPSYYQRVTTQTIKPAIYYEAVVISNEMVAEMALARGLSLKQYAIYRNVFNSIFALIPLTLAALLIWRARWKWFAWYTAVMIVFLGAYSLSEQIVTAQLMPIELFGVGAIFWFLVLLYFFLFPNGQAVPQRAKWLVGVLVIYHFFIQLGTVLAYIVPTMAVRFNLPNWGKPEYIWPVLLNFFIILACQIYRYNRVSTAIERQQTKWFLLGFGLIVALIPIGIAIETMSQSGLLDDFFTAMLWLPLYLGLAISILRYRLWDIDILIRRTLQYSILTGLLGLVYFGGVVLFQGIFRTTSGETSSLAIVLSTLIIAALFAPLRRRIQNLIDRRFFRQKYDAAAVLARFAMVARDEVEMEKLAAAVLTTIQDTVQPETVSIWLKQVGKQ